MEIKEGMNRKERRGWVRGCSLEAGIPERDLSWVGQRCRWRKKAPEERILKQEHQMDLLHRWKSPKDGRRRVERVCKLGAQGVTWTTAESSEETAS